MIGGREFITLSEENNSSNHGQGPVTIQCIRRVLRPTKPLWIRLVIEPLTIPIVLLVVKTPVTPLVITLGSFLLAMPAAWLFFTGDRTLMLAGALLYQLAMIGDYMDGMIARLKGTGSILALTLDHFLDNWRLFFCAMGLTYGQYRITEDLSILIWGIVFVFICIEEMQIPRTMAKVHHAYEEYYEPSLRRFDFHILRLRDWLARFKLKVIFFNVHERETLVLLFGPLLGQIKTMLIVSTALTLVFFWLRIYFDSVLIRQELLGGEKQYLGHTANVFGEVEAK